MTPTGAIVFFADERTLTRFCAKQEKASNVPANKHKIFFTILVSGLFGYGSNLVKRLGPKDFTTTTKPAQIEKNTRYIVVAMIFYIFIS